MKRRFRVTCPWSARAIVAAGVVVACHSSLDPVRLGQAVCVQLELSGDRYALCEDALSHEAAQQDCERRGAHLAAIENAAENEALAEAAAAMSVTSGNVWLGGTRSEDFVWSWSTGDVFWRGGRDGAAEPGAFALWQSEEPNNSQSRTGEPEACLALTAEGADWNDRACALILPYLCEWD